MTTKQNRNPIKQWFITFPQSGLVEQDSFLQVLITLNRFSYYIIGTEEHEDGSPHFHAFIKYGGRGITKSKLLKSLKYYYPDDWKRIHLVPSRSPADAVCYIQKECPVQIIQESQPYEEFLAEEKKTTIQRQQEIQTNRELIAWSLTSKLDIKYYDYVNQINLTYPQEFTTMDEVTEWLSSLSVPQQERAAKFQKYNLSFIK